MDVQIIDTGVVRDEATDEYIEVNITYNPETKEWGFQ